MTTEELLDYDDLGDALREGRALRPARGYRFLLAQGVAEVVVVKKLFGSHEIGP